MLPTFSVDGMNFNMPCSIEREASLTASEVSGMLLDKSYMNDVIGTFMKYSVKIAVPTGQENAYSVLYEVLSDPIDAHVWTFPYNQETIEITGRVEVISDKYYREEKGVNIWRGTAFTIIANHPSKERTLEEMITRGMTTVPLVTSPEIGDVYFYNAERIWEMIAHDIEEGTTIQYNGTSWDDVDIINLDEVAF